MLRRRIFYGIFVLVIVVWAVAAVAIVLMRQTTSRHDAQLRHDYKIINASLSVRTFTASLNVNYMPALVAEPMGPPPSRVLFDRFDKKFDETLAILRRSEHDDKRWDDLLGSLEMAIGSFRQGYEEYFSGGTTSLEQRAALMRFISVQTQRLTDLSGSMTALIEQEMLAATNDDLFGKNTLFVVIVGLMGTIIAILTFFALTRQLMDPIVSPRPIKEIRRGNLEPDVPEPISNSEIVPVASAFNEKVAELKLRRGDCAADITRSILEAVPSPVFILEDESGIVQTNPAAEQLSEKLGIMGRLPEKLRRILDDCIETNTHYTPEDPRDALLFRINEVEMYYLPRVFHFDAGRTTKPGWAVLLYNVTRIRWLDDIKTNLLSTVSHEIKTPLTGIRMVLHLLLEDRAQNLSETQRTMIASANDDSERLLLTLNSLLELSRAESGAVHLMCVPTQLLVHVECSVRLHSNSATSRNISIEVDSPQNELPEILADGVSIDEVLNNLIDNAIKHSPDGGVVKVLLSKPDSDHVRVSVVDQGAGVPEECRSLIFERFYQAPGQKRKGVGLGLFISREIIRAHQGRIGVNERKDELTEFYFDVPIA